MIENETEQYTRMIREQSSDRVLSAEDQFLNEIRRITDKLTGEEMDALVQMAANWRDAWSCGC